MLRRALFPGKQRSNRGGAAVLASTALFALVVALVVDCYSHALLQSTPSSMLAGNRISKVSMLPSPRKTY